MSAFFQRLRAALAPDYELLRELASGGMGTVYLAREVALERSIAIKVLRPELATAVAVERFMREARTLARLTHPNIVTVHKVDERDGLHWYAMDYLDGDTLQSRLETQGRLTSQEALKLGRDLLDALEAAHQSGVTHRDVKPANLFMIGRRGVLTDFGIAKDVTADDMTDPRFTLGTVAYMAPEQFAGVEANARTDIYAAGMVIYEAFTGGRWDKCPPADGDWSGVPPRVARVLRRALELDPADRWPEAASFRRALWHTREWTYQRRTIWLTVGGLVAGASLGGWLLHRWQQGLPPFRAPALRLHVAPFEAVGPVDPHVSDLLGRGLARSLAGYPDFSVSGPAPPPWLITRSTIVLRGTAYAIGDSLRVELRMQNGPRGGAVRVIGARSDARQSGAVVDSLAYGVVRELWDRENPFDPSLPVAALPRTVAGLVAWLGAERLLAQARWQGADSAYRVAEAVDSSCWLCFWRHAEVVQWLGREPDPAVNARFLAHLDAFPPKYQILIRASLLPLRARLDTLEAATRGWRELFLTWFMGGDETFHRGALVGRPRSEAVEMFRRTAQLRPDFTPAWEHLAWAETAEGDSAGAATALARLAHSPGSDDPFAHGLRALLELGFAWRFRGSGEAQGVTGSLLADAQIAANPDLGAGPRYLLTFDAPRGAVDMGAGFAALGDRRDLVRSGLIAQTFGYVALGRTDSALAVARALGDRFADSPDLALLQPELAGVLLLTDSGGAVPGRDVEAALAATAASRAAKPETRRRAAWMLLLLGGQEGRAADPPSYRGLVDAEPAPRFLNRLLLASEAAARGLRARALATSDSLTTLSASELAAAGVTDPFFRTVLHLLRARWLVAEGHAADARLELLWYQSNDYVNLPTGAPQMGDADAAFGTLARWRLANLLDAAGDRGDAACHAYRAVARLWAAGEPRYRARADSAGRRAAALGCEGVA